MAEIFDVYIAPKDQPGNESFVNIPLPATPYQLLDTFEKLRLEEGTPLYWEITGYRQFEELSSVLNDTCGLYDLNALAQRLSELTDIQRTAFTGFLAIEQKKGQPIPISRIIDLAYSTDHCQVVGEALNDSQLGRFLAENGLIADAEAMPDSLFDLLDFEKIGREYREGAGGVLVRRSMDHPGGYVEQHDRPRQVYKTLDLALRKPAYTILAETYDGSRVEFPYPANAPMGTEIVRCVDCAAPSLIGLSGGMEDVGLLARRLANLEPETLRTYKALLETADCLDPRTAVLLVDTLDKYVLSPQDRTPAEAATEELSVTLGEREAELLIPHLDLYEYGKALIQDRGGVMTPYGLIERVDGQPMQGMETKPVQGGMEMR